MEVLAFCEHKILDAQNNCLNCGIPVRQFYNEDTKTLRSGNLHSKNIIKDLENIEIEENIKHMANQTFKELLINMPKIKKKKQSLFFCLYEACKRLGIQKDSHTIAKLIDMPKKHILTALTSFSTTQTGCKTMVIETTPLDLLPEYTNQLKFTESQTQEIIDITKVILENDQELSEEMPRKLIAGVLKYYMCINGIIYDKKQFTELIEFSEATLNVLLKKISLAYSK